MQYLVVARINPKHKHWKPANFSNPKCRPFFQAWNRYVSYSSHNIAALNQFFLQSRNHQPKIVQYDWVAVDFCYYAIFVEIHRTRLQSAFSPAVHRQCLEDARKSLTAFHCLQQHSAEMPGFDYPYPSFLTWYADINPAFCVIFLIMSSQDLVSLPT